MDAMRTRVESWIKDRREKLMVSWSPPPLPRLPTPPQWRWLPWMRGRRGNKEEEEKRVREELERRRLQIQDLCRALKVYTPADLNDLLCSMVLCECVYKKPPDEMIRAINKFKADFENKVPLERVQPSLDHVPHRISRYKDVITRGRRITSFIHSISTLRAEWLKVNGKELVRCGVTRFATSFLTLESLYQARDNLRKFDWARWARNNETCIQVSNYVLSTRFWLTIEDLLRASEPIIKVLRLVDSDSNPTMAYLQGAFLEAKKAITENFKEDACSARPILDILDRRWEKHYKSPLVKAAMMLNPSSYYKLSEYLLAESGDTLYASFIGTKKYKDLMADVNILQDVLFHEEDGEDIDASEIVTSYNVEVEEKNDEKSGRPIQSKLAFRKKKSKPAAHRGFLARAKGIPALELYKLAKKKNRKLVLCGHSLGGAVAALATLAILRAISSFPSKVNDQIPVKCITFSQPPVGNAALRDYVHSKGWHHFFKTYCIPEDLVPRILSPAYFHHYNAQPLQSFVGEKPTNSSINEQKYKTSKSKHNNQEQLVLGLGPVQTSFWRLSRIVPIGAIKKQLNSLMGKNQESEEALSSADSGLLSKIDQMDTSFQSLEIKENSEGISLAPLHIEINDSKSEVKEAQEEDKTSTTSANSKRWKGVPSLPSYVPFGELYLLGNLRVDFLSDAEYSKLTSVSSMISELKERFPSHLMKTYRARFQKIHDNFMCMHASPFLGGVQSPQFSHLQQWLSLASVDAVVVGNIVDAPVILAASSIVPLNWSGIDVRKNAEPFKVDIMGYGLHMCTLIQAQINGIWCSASVESLPSAPTHNSTHGQSDLQTMRITVGLPLRRPPRYASLAESSLPILPSTAENMNPRQAYDEKLQNDGYSMNNEDIDNLTIFCTSDFTTVSKEVYRRMRRVRLLGLEGAGKTSLFTALLETGKRANGINLQMLYPHVNCQQGVVGGVCYSDSGGVNLQQLHTETNRFREELQLGIHDIRKKTDLIVLVHNLSHKVPLYHQSNTTHAQPALSLILNEAKALGIPWVLAVTNKHSVSAHQQRSLVDYVVDAYQVPSSMTAVINSCPYVIPSISATPINNGNVSGRMAAQSLILAPINLLRMPFQRKVTVMPVDGVNSLSKIVHHVLRSHEETTLQELAKERLSKETAIKNMSIVGGIDSSDKGGTAAAAMIGGSIGAGVGIVIALVMGAASALRKP